MERSVWHQRIQDFIWNPCLFSGRLWQRLLAAHPNPFPLLPFTQTDYVSQSSPGWWLNFSPQNVCGRDVTASRLASPKPSKVILPAQGSFGWRWGDLWQSKSLTCYLDQTLAHLSTLEPSSIFLWATSKLFEPLFIFGSICYSSYSI